MIFDCDAYTGVVWITHISTGRFHVAAVKVNISCLITEDMLGLDFFVVVVVLKTS